MIEPNYSCFWHFIRYKSSALLNENTSYVSHMFYWFIALTTTLLFVDRCSQLVRCVCVGYSESKHIISASPEQWSAAVYSKRLKLCVCSFVCLFAPLNVCMCHEDCGRIMSADIMLFWTPSCPLGAALVLPGPANWCISLVFQSGRPVQKLCLLSKINERIHVGVSKPVLFFFPRLLTLNYL